MTLTEPAVLLLAIPLFALTWWLWRRGAFHNPIGLEPTRRRWERRRRLAALLVRLLILAAILLALAGLAVRLPQSRQAVTFVSDLSASNSSNRGAMEAFINRALEARSGANAAGVVTFGRTPVVEQPVGKLSAFDGFQTPVTPDYTNIESGLELGAAILPPGYRHRIVVLSDGQQNLGDALASARLLRSQGVRIDVVPQAVRGGPDVRVDAVSVPSQLRAHERFSLGVSLHSTVNTSARLDLYRDRSLILSRQELVYAGDNHYAFAEAPLSPGFHSYRVQTTPAVDSQPENNSGSAFTFVQGPPRILVIAASSGEAHNVVASLNSNGILVDVRAPAQVIPSLASLQRYAGVVIVNTAAPLLGQELLRQLVPYVRDLGRGLVVIGGEESFGLGGYGQTPLEQALPVQMDVPKRKDVPSAAVVLIIETLEEAARVNISKEAGKEVIKLLTERDWVAVNDTPTDGTTGWTIPLQHVRDKVTMLEEVGQMVPGDPNSYTSTFQLAYHALQAVKARVKHIILLGDGDAFDQSYQGIVRKIRGSGITVSAIITNGVLPSDFKTMRTIARLGGGRYYRADDPKIIPKVFLREAQAVARSGIVQGKFYPQKLSENPMIRTLRRIPPLYGYVATAPKPTSELELVSHKLDPILTSWQFGSGRAVAWTSDAAGLWTKDWLASPNASRFWSDVVSWTLPPASSSHLFVTATTSQGQGRISVDTPGSLGSSPAVTARVVDPNLQATTVHLEPSAPGRYQGGFAAPSQGAYIVTVEAHGAGHAEAGQAGMEVPYSAEYRVTGTDTSFLQSLASAGGGSVITRPESTWLDNLSKVTADRALADQLWLLALLLLPIDVGLRRLAIERRDLERLWIAIRRASKRSEPIPPHSQPVPVPSGTSAWVMPQSHSSDRSRLGPWHAIASVRSHSLANTSRFRRPGAASRSMLSTHPPQQSGAVSRGSRASSESPSSGQKTPTDDTTVGKLLAAKRRRM